MDPILYKSVGDGNLAILRQYNNQLHEQLDPNKSNLLHVSSQFHDSAEFVKEILNNGQSSEVKRCMLTWKNSEGETALHIASRNGRSNIVRVFIEHGQALDGEELENGVKISEEMMRATDPNGDTALHVAVRNNHKEVAELLLTNDPHFKHPINNMKETPLYLAIEGDYHDIVNLILTICTSPNYEGPDGKTALHAAVLSGCRDCVTKILEKNPTLARQADETGWIPLHYAAGNYYDTSPLEDLLNADRSTAYVRTSKDENKTAMHIAACRGNERAMQELLNRCPDCWVMVTSKGQNVLHLVVENEKQPALEFILRKKWAINLINQKDAEGNTPLHHLFVKGVAEDFDVSSLLNHPQVDYNAVNKENFTPLDLLEKLEKDYFDKEALSLYQKLRAAGAKRGARKLTSIDTEKRDRDERYQNIERAQEEVEQRIERRLKALREIAGTHLLVATLIATVTFAAGFTLPGGYDGGNQGPNQGMAVLIRKAAFKTFVVTDTIAVMSSITAVFLHFSATFYQNDEDAKKLLNRHISALVLIVIAMMTMVIAFITGLYTVLHGSSALAITVCVVGCFAILLFCYMIQRDCYKIQRDVHDTKRKPYIIKILEDNIYSVYEYVDISVRARGMSR